MPWCSPCERFFNPNTLQVDGRCPDCGEPVAASSRPANAPAAASPPADAPASASPPGDAPPPIPSPPSPQRMAASDARPSLSAQAEEDRAAEPPGAEPSEGRGIPWHFWLLITATAGYLIWRFVQVIARLFGA